MVGPSKLVIGFSGTGTGAGGGLGGVDGTVIGGTGANVLWQRRSTHPLRAIGRLQRKE